MIDVRSIPAILFRSGLTLQPSSLTTWDYQVNDEVRRRNQLISKKRSLTSIDSADPCSGDGDNDTSSQSRSLPLHTQSEVLASSDLEAMSQSESTLASWSPSQSHLSQSGHAPQLNILWPQARHNQGQESQGEYSLVQVHTPNPEHLSTLDEEQYRHMLDSMSKHDLVGYTVRQYSMVTQQMHTIEHLRHEARMDKQRIRRLTQRLSNSKEKLLTSKNPEVTDLQVFRGKAKKLSWRGSISLGLRKAMAFVSASSFPMSSMMDIGRNTVIRCEILVNCYIMVRARFFHRIIFLLLDRVARVQDQDQPGRPSTQSRSQSDMPDHSENQAALVVHSASMSLGLGTMSHDDAICKDFDLPFLTTSLSACPPMTSSGYPTTIFSIGCTCFSGDATNASIWKRQKLQGLMVTTSVMVDWISLCQTKYRDAFKTMNWMFFGQKKSHRDESVCVRVLLVFKGSVFFP